jgi:hypothetical protein
MGKENSQETVRSFVFSDLPLKAEQHLDRSDGWSTAAETWLAEAAKTCNAAESFSDVSKYLKELRQSRSQLLGLLQTTSSSPAEVTTAQTRYGAQQRVTVTEVASMSVSTSYDMSAVGQRHLPETEIDFVRPCNCCCKIAGTSPSWLNLVLWSNRPTRWACMCSTFLYPHPGDLQALLPCTCVSVCMCVSLPAP